MAKRIDIENFFVFYERNLIKFLSEKEELLENFKKKEENLKKYLEAISELEKIKNEINFTLFQKESEEFLNVLLKFDTEDILKNVSIVEGGIAHLNSVRFEIEEISNKFLHIKSFWENYALKKYNLDTNAKFAKDINTSLKDISEEIANVTFEELQRLEDKIAETKIQIERSISIINDLKSMIENHIFIGDKEIDFFNKIKDFIKNKYKEMSLSEVSEFSEEVHKEFKLLKSKSKAIKKKIPVYKVESKNKKVYSYAIMPKEGVYLNISDIEIDNPIYIDTDRFIYVENYPDHGIFTIDFIKHEMEIPDYYFEAIKEFDNKTTNYFIVMVIFTIFTVILNLLSVLPLAQTLALTALYPLVFIFMFKRAKKTTDKKYKLWKVFYFYETNFLFIKEGDPLFKPQNIIPLIVVNFSKLFKVNEEIK